MKKSSMDKINSAAVYDMVYLENIVNCLEMEISKGFMDDLTEIFTRTRRLNEEEAWGFYNSAMRILSTLAIKKLAEKIEEKYLEHAGGETTEDLKTWAEHAAYYFVNEMDDERPASEKLNPTIEEQVYKEIEDFLGIRS